MAAERGSTELSNSVGARPAAATPRTVTVYLAPPGLDQHRVGEILAVFRTHAGANVITHERLFRFDPKEGFIRTATLPHQLVQRLKRGGVFVDAAGR